MEAQENRNLKNCSYCGEEGHIARGECPEKKRKQEEKQKLEEPKIVASSSKDLVHHSAKVWAKEFERSAFRQQKRLRIDIIEQTLQVCDSLKYSYEGKEVCICKEGWEKLEKRIQSTFFFTINDKKSPNYYRSQIKESNDKSEDIDTKIAVENMDCLVAAINLKNQGFNPVVLNMASSKRPGGGYMSGAGAQEENLFRRSNYNLFLADKKYIDAERKWSYPLPELCAIYTPDVTVFRGTEKAGYPFLEQPVDLSFIAASAYKDPPTVTNGASNWKYLREDMAQKTVAKLDLLLCAALHHQHDSIVLSAFGCGAYNNPPYHMALLFKQVLAKHHSLFKKVVFAIIEDNNSTRNNTEGNFKPFFEVFSGKLPIEPAPEIPNGSGLDLDVKYWNKQMQQNRKQSRNSSRDQKYKSMS